MGRIRRTRVARVLIVVLSAVGMSTVGLGVVGATTPALPSGPAGVTGTVLDGTTFPEVAVDQVEVCLDDGTGRICHTTDPSGRFTFADVATGHYRLTATPPAGTAYLPIGGPGPYVPVPAEELDLTAGTQTRDLRLLKGGTLEVTVLEPDGVTRAAGQPVSACRTDDGPGACPDTIALPSTDAAGESIGPPLLPGVYRVTAGRVTSTTGSVTVDDVTVDPEATTSLRVRRVDVAPPVVTGTPAGVAGANGWYLGAVTVTWSVVDPAPSSGLRAPLPSPSTFGVEGANTFLSDEAFDAAGNHASGQILLKIDSIPPVVTCPTDVHFASNQSGAALTATVSDPTPGSSGPEAATVTAPVDTSSGGPGSVALTGRDLAGNETTVACGYVVDPPAGYRFLGFSWPIDNGSINVVRSGRHVPLAWRLTDATGRGVTNPASVVGLTSATVACPAVRSDLVELTLPVAQPPRPVGAGFWFGTWRAPAAVPGSCTELRLALDDGSVHTAVFRVVK